MTCTSPPVFDMSCPVMANKFETGLELLTDEQLAERKKELKAQEKQLIKDIANTDFEIWIRRPK